MSKPETSIEHSEVRLLGWRELRTKLGGRSYTSICRDEREGRFPQRVLVGKRGIGWYRHEIDAFLLSLPRGPRDES